MTPVGLIILICLVLVILFGSREWAAAAVIASIVYLAESQHIYLAEINLYAERLIEIAGFIRIVTRGELRTIDINNIDKAFLAFQIVYLSVFMICSFVHPSLIESRAYRIGFLCDGVLSYFIFRSLVADPPALENFLKKCAYIIVPFAALMIMESTSGKNLFSLFEASPAVLDFRNGHYRAEGSFGVSITAGSFGATLLPLFIAVILSRGRRFWAITGIAACVMITYSSHASGPLTALAAGITALLCWRIRARMRLLRWGAVLSIIFLHLIMKAPVWFIIDRLGDIAGGHGYDRAILIDYFVKSFGDWWLMGMPMNATAGWGEEVARLPNGMLDVLNTYVSIGLSGGLLALFMFIRLIVKCFRSLGISLQSLRAENAGHIRDEMLLWGIGCCLFSHIVNISGVTYFDQMYAVWYMTLALVSGLTAYYRNEIIKPAEENHNTVYDNLTGEFNRISESI